MDVVNPDLHHDPACRVTNHSSDMERIECMGKSILHHAAKLHGYDADMLQEKLAELNIDVSKGLVEAARTFGYLREGRGQAKSAFFEKRAKDEAAAGVLMRESRARSEAKQQQQQGRRLDEAGASDEGFGSSHGLGQHAMHAGGLRRQLQNASGVMHRGMMAIDRAATAANNAQSRGPAAARQRARAPHPDDLDWHAARNSVPSPLTAILAVSAEEGSLASRFGNGIVKLNALRDRVSGALRTTRRRLEAHDAGMRRRLHANAAHADALYEALERSHADAPPERRALELPESHALSWVHVRLAFAPLEHAHAHAHAPSAHIRALFRSSLTGTASSTRARGCTASRARGTSCARRARRTPRSSGSTRRGTTTSTTRTTRAPRSRATRCAACCTARRRAPTRRGTSRPCSTACTGA